MDTLGELYEQVVLTKSIYIFLFCILNSYFQFFPYIITNYFPNLSISYTYD